MASRIEDMAPPDDAEVSSYTAREDRQALVVVAEASIEVGRNSRGREEVGMLATSSMGCET